jgi:hypothetical protein
MSEFWDLYRDGVTQSWLKEFQSCRVKQDHGFRKALQPVYWTSSFALDFGDLFHRCLDEVYTYFSLTQEMPHWKGILADLKEEAESKQTELTTEKQRYTLDINYGFAEILLREYLKIWKADFENKKWVSLEEIFDVPFPSQLYPDRTIRVRGKRDGKYRTNNGELWLFETKTKGRIEDETILQKLSFERQVMLYSWAETQQSGELYRGVLYNLVRRPMLRHGAKESTTEFLARVRADVESRHDHYFMRCEAPFNPITMMTWRKKFKALMWDVEHWWLFPESTYENSESCGYGDNVCPYLPLCSTGDMTKYRPARGLFGELSVIK